MTCGSFVQTDITLVFSRKKTELPQFCFVFNSEAQKQILCEIWRPRVKETFCKAKHAKTHLTFFNGKLKFIVIFRKQD